jgi:hypothetical protein
VLSNLGQGFVLGIVGDVILWFPLVVMEIDENSTSSGRGSARRAPPKAAPFLLSQAFHKSVEK